jgi:hypothetical protein
MNKKDLFAVTSELLKHKDELLKEPEAFKLVLESLRKAAKDDEDYGDGFSIVDDPNEDFEGDEADKWLKAQEGKKGEAEPEKAAEEPAQRRYMRDWEPQAEYSPEQQSAIDKHMANGYSHREAERMAGAHKSTMDLVSAMRSGVAPSMMSDKMMGDLKPLAKLWLEEADKQDKLKADPESNTVKRHTGKLMEAYDKHAGDYNKAYNEFLASDKLKDKDGKPLKGKDRHTAVQNWKTEWKQQNPQHGEGMQNISEVQQQYAYNQNKAKESVEDKMKHIYSGGQSMPTEMSDAEAMQHLGGGKTEEGYQGTIIQDPSASFAARNPQLLAALKPEQQERLNRVDSAAKAQGKVRIRKGGAQ